MRISDWSSDVCSSDLLPLRPWRHELAHRCLRERAHPDRSVFRCRIWRARHCSSERRCLLCLCWKSWPNAFYFPSGFTCPDWLNLLRRSSEIYSPCFDLSWRDRKSTRLNSSTNAHLVCRLLLEKQQK